MGNFKHGSKYPKFSPPPKKKNPRYAPALGSVSIYKIEIAQIANAFSKRCSHKRTLAWHSGWAWETRQLFQIRRVRNFEREKDVLTCYMRMKN